MELLIERKWKGADVTVGSLYVDGHYFCETLEPHCIDWSREEKVWGKTAIPEGTYAIEWRESKHFKRVMPYLKEVPHFMGVMIHPGNTVNDTQGCILVGRSQMPGQLCESRNTFERLLERMKQAPEEEITITVL